MLAFAQLSTSAAEGNGPSIHSIVTLVLGLLVAVVALAILAPRLRMHYSILLVLGGLLLGFIPGLPHFTLDPDLVFLLFLPPLIYLAAWNTSWRDFRASLRPISFLAIGLVLFTIVGVAWVARLLIPGLPWSVACVLGAVVSPTDAIAATATAQRLGIPRRIVTILEGESLLNDASGLVAYRFAVAAVVSGTFSLGQASLTFVAVCVGSVALGLAVGWCIATLHRSLNQPSIEIVITLLTPFAVYLLSEALQMSGVLAVVTTGLYIAWRAPRIFSAELRLQSVAFWNTLEFLLNGLVFILIGLQLPAILDTLNKTDQHGHTFKGLLWYAIIISLAVILVRILWVFPASYLPRLLSRRLRARDPYPNWRTTLFTGWTGMRGVMSLATALAIPDTTATGNPFPERSLLIFLTFCVIFATLVLQGLSLPLVARWLGLEDDGKTEAEETKAHLVAIEAALDRIDALDEEDEVPHEVAEHLRTHYENRAHSIRQRIQEAENEQDEDAHHEHTEDTHIAYKALLREALQAERNAVISLRNEGEINDEVLRHIERELDLQEQQLPR